MNRDWSRRKPTKKDDVVYGSNPPPWNGERERTFNQHFGRVSNKEVCAVQRFGVDNGVVNYAEFSPVGQVDIQAGPVGHDLNALDHAIRFR